jgi:hypothetical protein
MNIWMRKSSALAILGGLVLALYLAFVAPMLEAANERDDELTRLTGLSERYTRAAHEVPALEEKLAQMREQGNSEGTLEESNETLAGAALQSRLKTSVMDSGGKLQSAEVLPAESAGKRQKIAVRARIAIGLGGLQRVMQALNETHPALFVETLDIRQPDGGRVRSQVDAGALDIDVTVYGYLRGHT